MTNCFSNVNVVAIIITIFINHIMKVILKISDITKRKSLKVKRTQDFKIAWI